MNILMAYVPVIHSGYLQFFQQPGSMRFVFGEDVINLIDSSLDYLRKEIRALNPEEARKSLSALLPSDPVAVLSLSDCEFLACLGHHLVLADEDASRVLVEKCFPTNPVSYSPVFLRWDRDRVKVNQDVIPDQVVILDQFNFDLMSLARQEAEKSSDWWRRVGAVAVSPSGQVLFSACNHHLPTPHTPYINGDPRNTAKRGEGLELYSSIHAEASVVAQAAQAGVSLKGAHLYVSTFPCPNCALLTATSGISRLYYAEGYALLDGAEAYHQFGVELVYVTPGC